MYVNYVDCYSVMKTGSCLEAVLLISTFFDFGCLWCWQSRDANSFHPVKWNYLQGKQGESQTSLVFDIYPHFLEWTWHRQKAHSLLMTLPIERFTLISSCEMEMAHMAKMHAGNSAKETRDVSFAEFLTFAPSSRSKLATEQRRVSCSTVTQSCLDLSISLCKRKRGNQWLSFQAWCATTF